MILTDYTENKLLDLIFGATAWASKPGTLYYALFTSAPSDTGGGTEVSAGGYARVAATVGSTYFEAATTNGGPVTNKLAVTFPTSTAAWGTVTHMGIIDAASGGNLIACKALPATVVIAINQTASWAIGDLSFDTAGSVGDWLGKSLLNYLFIGTAMPTIANHYFALGTGASESGISGEETIGTDGYARKSMANNNATWGAAASGAKSNAALIQFAAASGNWPVCTHFGILSAAGAGASVVPSDGATDMLFTAVAHKLVTGNIIQFTASALPTGLLANTNYYVTVLTVDTFNVSLTSGGAVIEWGGSAGTTVAFIPLTIWHGALDAAITPVSGDQPQWAVGALEIELD